ncbi:uncharacterized protein LOC123224970 [Mangifera indica]|uniref:uncharacterized protein LOC123224970 n=1 Tax=Mangifera indica TaxID=29780 RepID=UPI001CFB79C3|nr:uncharacterized protein LOC123224970 [Mangifera indica]XP_044504712.1 uncharacterized protein LOC123224970 [Mangifera indica]
MEYFSELGKDSGDQPSTSTSDKTKLPQANRKTYLPDRVKLERCTVSYADLHQEITKGVKDFSYRSAGNCQKQLIDRKGNEEDELVKYMSSLPSYLERGKNPQEKVLNVGVLDWDHLEKWHCSHKQMPHRVGRSSISSSSVSSSFSTDASSFLSSSGYISSPPGQKTQHSSLQFHPMPLPMEGYSQAVKSFGESVQRFPDIKDAQGNNLNEQGKFIRTDKPFGKNNEDILEVCKEKDLDPKIDQESGTLANGVKYEVASSKKVKMKAQDGQFMKKAEKLQERNPDVVEKDVLGKHKPIVLLLPRGCPKNDLSGVSNLSSMTTMLGQRRAEDRPRSLSERPKDAELVSDFPHSSPLPQKVGVSKNLLMKRPSTTDSEIDKFSTGRSHQAPSSAETGFSLAQNLEGRKSTVTINKSTSNVLSVGLDIKLNKVAPEKVRSTSPFCRLSFSMSKISKNSGSKEASALHKPNSTYVSAHSSSENAVVSSHLDTSCSGKINSTNRASSSPLRRLLDPILKPKAANCRNVADPLQKDLTSKEKASKYSDEQPCSSSAAAQSRRVKANVAGRRKITVNDSLQEKQHGSRALQALLRVTVKSGQPMFTFAVDNECDILAATMKKSSASGKEDYSCCYTFFTFQEVKKKKGRWLNQGGKGQSHDFIPSVVARMNVCESHFSKLTRENDMNQFSVREFVLSSVELRQTDQQTSDFEPNDELAAMVVKIPLKISRSLLRNGYQGTMQKDLPEVGFKEYLPGVTLDSDSGKKVQNWPFIGGQEISATVILPSGVHTLPRKGEPSSLIQRWKTGGSCDCGGWDLGCKLMILANWNQFIKKAGSSNACSSAHQFELFSEGGQEKQPFFILAPCKEGISVEFNSSVTVLQAFSICIAILDSRKQCESSESRNIFEQKTCGETVLVQNDGTTVSAQNEGEVPARYISYPPHSPVGRV